MSSGEHIPPVENGQNPDAIPEPIAVRTGDAVIIANVYEHGASDQPDITSVAVAEEYLVSRFTEDPKQRKTVVARGVSFSYPVRVDGPDTLVSVRRKTNEWRMSPRAAAIITLGSAVVANVAPLAQTAIGLSEQAGHAVYRAFHPLKDKVEVQTTPSYDEYITVEVPSINKVNESDVNHQAVTEFSDLIHNAEQDGATIRRIAVEGNSSDEFGSDEDVTRINAGNTELEIKRVTITADTLQQILGTNLPVEIEREHKENVLSPEQRDDVLAEAQAAGYATITEAINAVDAGQEVQPKLAEKIKELFTSKRGTVIRATVTKPGKEIKTEVTTKEQDNPPVMPDVDWTPFLVPVLLWRKRERVSELRGTKRWIKKTKQLFLKPKVIEEDLNTAWVRLRPEAIQEDKTLVKHPWAYSRKYEALLREGRIQDVMRADFQIAGKDGEEAVDKSLRIMFIDHSPTQETIAAFAQLAGQFANMQNGALADKISGIFVYPSSSAGKEHGKPEKIGLGVDKQDDANTLGVCTPLLELVEMHMDTTQDPEELLAMFADHKGPLWTLAHEVAGHGTDIATEKIKVEAVRARGISGAHIVTGNSWVGHMTKLRRALSSIAERRQHDAPIEYDISYTALDANGEPVEMNDRVIDGDPRLALAQKATIVRTAHTNYAGTDLLENYAETAAAVTTGIETPFAEADTYVPQLETKNGKTAASHTNGYRPDQHAQRIFTDSVGAKKRSYPVTFANSTLSTVTVMKAEDDPIVREHLVRARKEQFATTKNMVSILTHVVH